MAEVKPLVFYDDTKRVEYMRAADTAPSAGGGGNIARTLLTPTGSEVIATNTAGVTYGFYAITGILKLTINGNSKFLIL